MSLSNYPTTRPSLILDFQKSEVVDPRVTFTRASSATRYNSYGVLETVGTDIPRIDFNPSTLVSQGLLIEESRTNSIRNNTMVGAVAGTPGTLPTNWTFGNTAGLTTSIIGTGTETGITYVDVRLNGTATSTGFALRFESLNQQAASSGQAWTGATYLRVVGGSTTNVTSIQIAIFGRDATNTNETESFSSSDVKGSISGALSVQRTTVTGTLASASTAFICERLSVSVTNGAAVDITLRIGLPQLELGAFATSVIPTSTVAVTRSADIASMTGANFSSWYNAVEGTVYTQGQTFADNSASRTFVHIDDTTTNNRIMLNRNTSRVCAFTVSVSGVNQADITNGPTISDGSTGFFAAAYKLNDFAVSSAAAAPATDTSGTVPTVSQMLIGSRPGGTNIINGYLRRISYYPTRLANAQLQALTAT